MNYKQLLISILLIISCLIGCVGVYDVRYELSANIVTVDGFVRDNDLTSISIRLSQSYQKSLSDKPIKGCLAEILVGNGAKIKLEENENGLYVAPNSFRGTVGQTYQLRFKTPDGKDYQSTVEKLNSVSSIQKIYQQFNQKGLLSADGKNTVGSTFDIYIDTNDPTNQKNFYLWEWSQWEKLYICITCQNGTLNGTTAVCEPNNFSSVTYDYVCSGDCYGILHNSKINVLADTYVNGLPIVGRLIAQTPYYSKQGSLIEVRQYGVSATAYDYYKLLSDQSETTGTLTDTPPAAIIGNVRNINDPTENIAGYFGAASMAKTRFWIDRNGFNDGVIVPLLGREPQLEPNTPFRPPTMPCLPSRNRTPIKPDGWK